MKASAEMQPSESQGGPGKEDYSSTLKRLWWAYFPATLVAILGIIITDGAYVLALQREQSRVELAQREQRFDEHAAVASRRVR